MNTRAMSRKATKKPKQNKVLKGKIKKPIDGQTNGTKGRKDMLSPQGNKNKRVETQKKRKNINKTRGSNDGPGTSNDTTKKTRRCYNDYLQTRSVTNESMRANHSDESEDVTVNKKLLKKAREKRANFLKRKQSALVQRNSSTTSTSESSISSSMSSVTTSESDLYDSKLKLSFNSPWRRHSSSIEKSISNTEYSSDHEYEDFNVEDDFISSDDPDYIPPRNVVEDVVIHQGMAKMRNLKASENFMFDSDTEEACVMEVYKSSADKSVSQPPEYDISELRKLDYTGMQLALVGKGADIPDNRPNADPISDDSGGVGCLEESSSVGDDNDLSWLYDDNDMEMHLNNEFFDHNAHTNRSIAVIEVVSFGTERRNEVPMVEPEEIPEESDVLPSEFFNRKVNANLEATIYSVPMMEQSPMFTKASDEHGIESAGDKQTASNVHASYCSIFCNELHSDRVLVLLREPIYIYGTVKLTLLAGSVEAYGYEPPIGEEVEIFSPRGLSNVGILPKAHIENAAKEAFTKELSNLKKSFLKSELDRIRETMMPQQDALIILRANTGRERLINTFKKCMNENVFPNMNCIHTDRASYASEHYVQCIINGGCDRSLQLHPRCSELPFSSDTRMMFIGGKSVGKSTLLRQVINRHLRDHPRILLVDLDIGQPEMFVPQTVGAFILSQPLLGPGFFMNRQPLKSFVVGSTNIVMCSHPYMRAVMELLRFCRTHDELSKLPWVINTMGYNKGFGVELIAVICEFLRPTDVVQLQSNKSINNFDVIMSHDVLLNTRRLIYHESEFQVDAEQRCGASYRLHVFDSAVLQESRYQKEWDMRAKDMRFAILLARLSEALGERANYFINGKPLCTSLDNLKTISLIPGNYTREQLLKAAVANVVYLCSITEEREDDSAPISCIGIGIVRAIDYHIKQIYLLPALPHELMTEVNCLALGEMTIPSAMMINQGPNVAGVIPYVCKTTDTNASKSIKQIYRRPEKFFNDKRTNPIECTDD